MFVPSTAVWFAHEPTWPEAARAAVFVDGLYRDNAHRGAHEWICKRPDPVTGVAGWSGSDDPADWRPVLAAPKAVAS